MPVSTSHRGLGRSRVLVASVLAAALGVLAAPSAPTAQANLPVERTHHHHVITVKVRPTLFGVHDANLNSLSRRGTGSIRLWDSATTWPDLEPTQGTFNWSHLDTIVKAAHRNHTQVTLVLGLSPAYAASNRTAPPNVSMYRSYVHAVMARYRPKNWGYRGIANYQVWNEINISTFWTGTREQAATLTKVAYDVRNKVDRGARLIAPAMVTRLGFEQNGLRKFYSTKVPSTHKPVWKYVDAISLNLYPVDRVRHGGKLRPSTPEDSMDLLKQVRALLHQAKVPASKPIWNTEVNYGLGRTATIATISNAAQVANVMRTYLLNAANGVQQVDWYAYDMGEQPGGGTLGNTLLTDPTNRAAGILTPAGRAFTRIQAWMKGTLVGTATKGPCAKDRHGTYTCVVRYGQGMGRIYWNPYKTAKVKLVGSATTKTDELGSTSKAKGGSRLTVNFKPVLVKSKK